MPSRDLPEDLLAELGRIGDADIEAVTEFVRMLESPGPHDQNVLSFIRNHLLDPELRSQRRYRG